MNNDDVDERIRAALRAAAEEIDEAGLRAEHAPAAGDHPAPGRRARWLAPVLAAAAVVAVAVGTAAVVHTGSASKARPATSASPTNSSPTSSSSTSSSSSPEPTRSPSTVFTSPPAATADTSPTNPPSVGHPAGPYRQACYFDDLYCRGLQSHVHYQPLWPFPNYAAERAWQVASRSGAQPWHLDAGQTALLFAQNYLGFADITAVTRTTAVTDGIEVGVGYPMPGGQLHTAAALHLVRYSVDRDDSAAGWEVVGSDDTDFSLEQPAYGSAVTSPMTVGGHITGVDENIVVDAKDLSGSVVTGTPPAVPAGGENSPWRSTVSFHATGVLTVVAFTGGHLTQHERFAIQGVHT